MRPKKKVKAKSGAYLVTRISLYLEIPKIEAARGAFCNFHPESLARSFCHTNQGYLPLCKTCLDGAQHEYDRRKKVGEKKGDRKRRGRAKITDYQKQRMVGEIITGTDAGNSSHTNGIYATPKKRR